MHRFLELDSGRKSTPTIAPTCVCDGPSLSTNLASNCDGRLRWLEEYLVRPSSQNLPEPKFRVSFTIVVTGNEVNQAYLVHDQLQISSQSTLPLKRTNVLGRRAMVRAPGADASTSNGM